MKRIEIVRAFAQRVAIEALRIKQTPLPMILNGLLKCARHACFSSVAFARDPCSSQTAARGSSRVRPPGPDAQVSVHILSIAHHGLWHVPASGPLGRGLAQSVEHRDVD